MKVKTNYDGCGYLTAGKVYEVKGGSRVLPIIVDDDGDKIAICTMGSCAHLDGIGRWEGCGMTVAELIEVLSLLNPEAIVVTRDDGHDLNRRVVVNEVKDERVWDDVGGWIFGANAISITNY